MRGINLTKSYPKASLALLLVFNVMHAFAQQVEEITFTHAGKTVYGTFSKPNGSAVFPVVIINSGSGANDRHGTLVMEGANAACLYPNLLGDTLKPYKGLADALVDSGFAVLRFDKLEYTYPTTLGTITFEKLWLPVESAIAYVKTRTDVDSTSINLIGHSEGSSLIPYIAKRNNGIRSLISLAGPRTPLDSVLAYQLMEIATQCGGNVPQTQTQVDQVLAYFTAIRNNTWNASTPAVFGIPASVWDDYIEVVDSVSINYNQVNLPTLFIGLGLDFNVPPPELLRFQNEITCTNDFWSIPDLIHYMSPSNSPVFSEALSDTIVYWLRNFQSAAGMPNAISSQRDLICRPNPFSESIRVSLALKQNTPIVLRIRNLVGQEVMQLNFENESTAFEKTLTLDFLPAGQYYIQCSTSNSLHWSRIVKQ